MGDSQIKYLLLAPYAGSMKDTHLQALGYYHD